MELRRNEMAEQVRNKAARKRLQEQFRAQQAARDAAGRKKDSGASKKHAESPSMADRWTLEEGLVQVADGGNHNSGTLTLTHGIAAAAPAAAAAPSTVAGPKSQGGNNKSERDSAKVSQAEASAAASTAVAAAAVVPRDPADDRWGMNDGAADLAERGVELEGGGAGLYLPPPLDWPPDVSLLPGGAKGGRRGRKRNRQARAEKEEAEWLEMVSKRVRSTVVGAAPPGTWGAANEEDGNGDAVAMDVVVDGGSLNAVGAVRVGGSEGGANRAPSGAGSATGAVANVGGGDVEAELRQRLLAAMIGRSKSKSRSKLSGKENPSVVPAGATAVTAASAEKSPG